MCGIAGLISKTNAFGNKSSKDILGLMLNKLQYRGPDGSGTQPFKIDDWNLDFGHRRLSIIDLVSGQQPMTFKNHCLTFNGEIYNFIDLRTKLKSLGHEFSTTSDTEVLLKWLIEKGEEGISEIDGMFAFAWWNGDNNKLLIARDRIGIKPLYYFHSREKGLGFASELSALMQDPRVPFEIDKESLQTYFFLGYPGTENSLVNQVKKLPPGQYMIWQPDGQLILKKYWQPKHRVLEDLTEAQWLEKLDATLNTSVEKSLVADVPVGLFLSGGVDSSLLAYYAKKFTKSNLESYTIAFESKSFDESKFAQEVADHLGINHHERMLNDSIMLSQIDSALDSLDEPMADHSLLPTYFVSKFAAEHKKVVLGGDGGDELFGGYPSYQAKTLGDLYGMFPAWIRNFIIRPIVENLPSSDSYQSFEWKVKRFVGRWNSNEVVRHMAWMGISASSEAQKAMEFPAQRLKMEKFAQDFPKSEFSVMDFDLQTYLSEFVLTKVDRASMKNSLEVRPPLLSNPVIDLAFEIPMNLKVNKKETKILLKKLAAKHLPEGIVYRKKQGFSVPLASWLRGPLAPRLEQILKNSPVWETGLHHKNWKFFAQSHQNRKGNYASLLWALVVYDHWLKRHT